MQVHAQVGEGQREEETQNLKQAPASGLSAQSDAGLEPMNREISPEPKEVRRLTDSHAGTPGVVLLSNKEVGFGDLSDLPVETGF